METTSFRQLIDMLEAKNAAMEDSDPRVNAAARLVIMPVLNTVVRNVLGENFTIDDVHLVITKLTMDLEKALAPLEGRIGHRVITLGTRAVRNTLGDPDTLLKLAGNATLSVQALSELILKILGRFMQKK